MFWSCLMMLIIGPVPSLRGRLGSASTYAWRMRGEPLEYEGCSGSVPCEAHWCKNWEVCRSVLEYELLNLQILASNIVGSLVKSVIRVLIYRCRELERPIRSNAEYPSMHFYCGLNNVQVHSRCLTLTLKVTRT